MGSSTDLRFSGGNLLLRDAGVQAWGGFGNDPGTFNPTTPFEAERMALAFQMAAVHLREIGAKLPQEPQG